MTGIRAFSAHVPLTSSLLLFYYCRGPIAIAFQVNTSVLYFLYYYVQDIYDDGGPLCPV